MSISIKRLRDYCNYITSDEECLSELSRRMSVRFWQHFCRDPLKAEEARTKQLLLDSFIKELKAVMAESIDIHMQ